MSACSVFALFLALSGICLGWEWWVAWVLLSPQEPILCKLQWSHYKGEPNMTSGHPSITRKNRWCRCQETTNTQPWSQDGYSILYGPGLVRDYNAMRQISLLIILVVITINIHDCVTLCWQALSIVMKSFPRVAESEVSCNLSVSKSRWKVRKASLWSPLYFVNSVQTEISWCWALGTENNCQKQKEEMFPLSILE